MNEEINYEKLRLDVLQKTIDERGISCKNKKDEIIKYLKMDDDGKYIRDTLYEKNDKTTFLVGVDLKNQKHMIEIGNLVQKKEAHKFNMYSDNRIWFISNQKLIG